MILLHFIDENDESEYVVFLEDEKNLEVGDYTRDGYSLASETVFHFSGRVEPLLAYGDCYVKE